jgi:glutaredoxin 3
MENKRKVEVYSAGCPLCQDVIELVKSLACSSCDVAVLDMNKKDIALKAKQLNIGAVPAVVVDGELARCCTSAGPQKDDLRASGIGKPL